jgi:hypothetical protein
MVGEDWKQEGGRRKVQIMLKTGVKTPIRFPHNQMLFVPEADIGPTSYCIPRAVGCHASCRGA